MVDAYESEPESESEAEESESISSSGDESDGTDETDKIDVASSEPITGPLTHGEVLFDAGITEVHVALPRAFISAYSTHLFTLTPIGGYLPVCCCSQNTTWH